MLTPADEVTTGARLRTLRRWRGMSQVTLAGLAGVSPSWISMVEQGQRTLDRRSSIAAIASALRISETDLVGGPHLSSDAQQADPHKAIPALRAALATNAVLEPAVEQARPLPELVSAVTGRVGPLRLAGDYTGVGAMLPDVIDELHVHVAKPADEAARRLALETLIEACVAATDMANTLRYTDLAQVAALHAGSAASLLDDPVHQGKAAVLSLFAFPRERSWERRLAAAERAAGALEPHARAPLAFQVLGMLTLHAALAATVLHRPQVATHWLSEASQLAGRVPDDLARNWQYFSATNVAIWHLVISAEQGDTGRILTLASAVNQDKITVRARKADFLAEVGRGLCREPKTRGQAVHWLRQAEATAPQRIRNSPAVKQSVAFLLNRATATAAGRDLRGMAARMGVPH
jgi:transcriptional regulator with XRE-family HTH domain